MNAKQLLAIKKESLRLNIATQIAAAFISSNTINTFESITEDSYRLADMLINAAMNHASLTENLK